MLRYYASLGSMSWENKKRVSLGLLPTEYCHRGRRVFLQAYGKSDSRRQIFYFSTKATHKTHKVAQRLLLSVRALYTCVIRHMSQFLFVVLSPWRCVIRNVKPQARSSEDSLPSRICMYMTVDSLQSTIPDINISSSFTGTVIKRNHTKVPLKPLVSRSGNAKIRNST